MGKPGLLVASIALIVACMVPVYAAMELEGYGAEAEVKDPGTFVAGTPGTPDPTKPLYTSPRWDRWKTKLGLKWKVTAYQTQDDIVRPPGDVAPPGTTSQPDPTGITIPDAAAKRCRIFIEKAWIDTPVKDRDNQVSLDSKMAHELCHCQQAEQGKPLDEAAADACAADLMNPPKPQ